MMSPVNIPAWLQKNGVENTLSMPDWAADFRRQQWTDFVKTGLPTSKDERFKYTDLSFLANKNFGKAGRVEDSRLIDTIHQYRLQGGDNILLVFVNGYFMPALSDLNRLPAEIIACSLDVAMRDHAELIKTHWLENAYTQKYPFARLNAAQCTEGLFFHIPKACELSAPIHLLSLVVEEQEFAAYPRHLFLLDENSKLTLIEEYFSLVDHAYMMNVVTHVVAKKNSRLNHYKIQREGSQAVHMAHLFVQQMQDSHVNSASFAAGASFARDDVIVSLQESGAHCSANGFYHLRHDNQYIDYHVDILHAAPRSNSEMLYKGILKNKSRAVFNGRLHVEKDAQKTLAYQANHNLLLSPNAEVYSKPELEIYADDVKCKHGASTGQMDNDAIFYLRSRGIAREEAVNMLLQGFGYEILQRVTHPGLKIRIQERMR